MMDRERKWKIYFNDLDKNKCGEWSQPVTLGNTRSSLKTMYHVLILMLKMIGPNKPP